MNTMEPTRLERGLALLRQIDGSGGEAVLRDLEALAPDLGRYIAEFAFGDIYAREGLDLRERELVTLASLLTAGGCERQLAVHIRGALNVGLTQREILETFIQCIPYTGFPRVLNAVFTAREVFGREAP